MRGLAIAVAGVLIGGVVPASSQSSVPAKPTVPPPPVLYDASQIRAPIGHRQPRPNPEFTPEQRRSVDPIEDMAREDAALARRINGICRGC